jgi:hypothetical protein
MPEASVKEKIEKIERPKFFGLPPSIDRKKLPHDALVSGLI